MYTLRSLFHVRLNKTLLNKSMYLMHKKIDSAICNVLCKFKHTTEVLEFIETEEEHELYKEISNQYLGVIAGGHKVFLLQPYIKWGKDKKKNTTPELQMAESVALVESLPYWTVIDKTFAPLLSFQKKYLLGSGGLDNLVKQIKKNKEITAIFISINLLKHIQRMELQNVLGLPIYDRYSIIIHIFREHAKTPEAQLQVALAELPYIWKKMGEVYDQHSGQINFDENRKKLLKARESKLKKALEKLKENKKDSRNRRKKFGFPSITVIGYTNAGKSSLIKILSEDESLKPRNQLFATLDTISYEGLLPCRQKVLYMDTIGFIQDVPEMLLAPFIVTLEDAIISDVIVHVFDISHPDMKAQFQHVEKIIKPMLNENQSIIYVANKCDLIDKVDIDENTIAISCKDLRGIDELKLKLEQEIFKVTGRSVKRIRVKSGSLASSWLYKWTTVLNLEPDTNDPQYMFIDVVATDLTINEFKRFLKE
ncbi:putative GTP-binding protein 6 [Vespa mandarinia]|uniref:putative GTP-binding protein 6 n=1 Tax=Vespa mandarinia TaxID=7446 RepID=UPI0016109766|nr:putative GTP-binding protein 6 [Vespa mandarinia]